MEKKGCVWGCLEGRLGTWLPLIGGIGVVALSAWLRTLSAAPDPLLYAQLQFTSGILALSFAAAALVRFRGTSDRLPLVLATGFVLIGFTLASSSLSSSSFLPDEPGAILRDPLTWVIGRTLLGVLLLAALLVERLHPTTGYPRREILVALLFVLLLTVLLTVAHHHLPKTLVVHPGSFFSRPGNLIPAAFFLFAAIGFQHRLKSTLASFDRSLYVASALNFWCSLAAAQSDRRLDASFAFAAILQFASYGLLLGGALFDNLRLFDDARRLAATDPVTGLANYRRLIESLETEMQRTSRTGRPFALLLFDLDGLKQINDHYGHQVGTRALCRVADVLRAQSRAMDTGARHGGDEFALILPETSEMGAKEVLLRVCERVAAEGQQPTISVSAGLAVYPRDGNAVEKLMAVADQALYNMKEQHAQDSHFAKRTAV